MDVGALTSEQRDKLRRFKVQTRIDNEKYLRAHPEVQTMISDFLRDVILKRPDDIRKFAADHFARPIPDVATGSSLGGSSEVK